MLQSFCKNQLIYFNIVKIAEKLVEELILNHQYLVELNESDISAILVARVAKHDPLVAGADVHLVLADVDAARDVRRLLVDAYEHLARVAGQALGVHRRQVVLEGVEADLADLGADDLVVVELGLGRDLAEDHDHVVLGRRLAGDLRVGVLLEAGVEDGIRDLVRELVGVALVHGLGREEEDAPVLLECE